MRAYHDQRPKNSPRATQRQRINHHRNSAPKSCPHLKLLAPQAIKSPPPQESAPFGEQFRRIANPRNSATGRLPRTYVTTVTDLARE